MLGKLIKHEFRSTAKIMLSVDLLLLLITLIGCSILNTDIFDNEKAAPMAIFMVILYAFSLTAFGLVTLIYLYIRFYRNLFTAQGYLMHTLPVKPMQLFHSKLIVGYIWSLLNSILIIFSIFSLIFAVSYHFIETHGIDSAWKLAQMADSGETFSYFYEIFGYTPLQFCLQLFILQLVCSFSSLLTGYVSVLLGQLVEKYKLMAAVGFYILLYIINQIVCSIIMILPGLKILIQESDKFLNYYYKDMMNYGIISQILMGAMFYLAALFLMRRSVNLT